MKKPLFLAVMAVLLLAACSKKMHSASIKPVSPVTTVEKPAAAAVTVPETSAELPATHTPTALIIMDGYGKILTSQDKLPAEANIKSDYSKSVRGFTPNQIANLKYRYQTVPPKILYVPDIYTLKSLRGVYCVYKKKFWYWKNEDGLFYLDETYYK